MFPLIKRVRNSHYSCSSQPGREETQHCTSSSSQPPIANEIWMPSDETSLCVQLCLTATGFHKLGGIGFKTDVQNEVKHSFHRKSFSPVFPKEPRELLVAPRPPASLPLPQSRAGTRSPSRLLLRLPVQRGFCSCVSDARKEERWCGQGSHGERAV